MDFTSSCAINLRIYLCNCCLPWHSYPCSGTVRFSACLYLQASSAANCREKAEGRFGTIDVI
jgi:hypothetical protein